MPVPSSIADLSTTAASNYPVGVESIGTSLDDYLRSIQAIVKAENSRGADIASGTSITIPNVGSYFVVTGTTTITSIADCWNGRTVALRFSNALTLANSSGLILPGGANTTVAAGDTCLVVNESAGVWRVSASSGSSLVGFIQSEVGAVARPMQEKARETSVSVVDFMTSADRTANYLAPGSVDVTYAFVAAITYLSGGGKLLVPKSKYKLSDEIVLPSGITVEGEGAGESAYGSPPAATTRPTYLFQTTPGKSIFFVGAGLNAITIRNLAMGASLNVVANMIPTTDGRYGIRCEGSYPAHSWMVRIEDLLFYDLERGLSVNDPFAQINTPPHTYDWNCCPILATNCRFLYPKIGVYINTNNCDFSTFINCAFGIPAGGVGVHLKSVGYLRFIQCAGGGTAVSSNSFFYIEAAGLGSMDNLTLEGCQAEMLTQFIKMSPIATNAYRFTLTCRDCISEMGADLYLAGNVHFISENSRWSVGTYIDSANVRISSRDDYFSPTYGYTFLNGNTPDVAFVNFRAGPNPPSNMSNVSYDNGSKTIRAAAAPTTGKHKIGDRTYNNSATIGAPAGWHCTTNADPGAWIPFGQIGYRTNAGTPNNAVTPLFVGEDLLDTTNSKWYKSFGTAGNQWAALN